MKSFLQLVNSSIGKKMLMALTGLFWCGFLVGHITGNLLLFVGEKEFMAYAEFLESKKFLLYTAEVVMALTLLTHMYTALRLTTENRLARGVGYESRAMAGTATLASRTMLQTGLIVFIFLILHISTFKFGVQPGENLYQNVIRRFSHPLYSGFYVLAVSLLGLHVSHGLKSAFQTLGLHHSKYNEAIGKLSWLFGLFVALGFSSFPIYFLMRGGH